jgi:[calcium/calmodulin-dependent protein kinase] kinase
MGIKDYMTIDKARAYFRNLISALEYCHYVANVLHRDIKPENLLIDDDDTLKLADFGVSKMMENGDDTLTSKMGTQFYMCPEMLSRPSFRGMPADVWACGVVLYQMVNKKALPFNSSNLTDLQKIITTEEPNYQNITDHCLVDLLKHILDKDPEERYDIFQIKEHPWVNNHGRDPMRRLDSNQIVITKEDLKGVITKVV